MGREKGFRTIEAHFAEMFYSRVLHCVVIVQCYQALMRVKGNA